MTRARFDRGISAQSTEETLNYPWHHLTANSTAWEGRKAPLVTRSLEIAAFAIRLIPGENDDNNGEGDDESP